MHQAFAKKDDANGNISEQGRTNTSSNGAKHSEAELCAVRECQ
jgi:hypothetical protein